MPVRYPTVAKGKARLRLSVHAKLKFTEIQMLSEKLAEAMRELS